MAKDDLLTEVTILEATADIELEVSEKHERKNQIDTLCASIEILMSLRHAMTYTVFIKELKGLSHYYVLRPLADSTIDVIEHAVIKGRICNLSKVTTIQSIRDLATVFER